VVEVLPGSAWSRPIGGHAGEPRKHGSASGTGQAQAGIVRELRKGLILLVIPAGTTCKKPMDQTFPDAAILA
jgi:hypothetical protein